MRAVGRLLAGLYAALSAVALFFSVVTLLSEIEQPIVFATWVAALGSLGAFAVAAYVYYISDRRASSQYVVNEALEHLKDIDSQLARAVENQDRGRIREACANLWAAGEMASALAALSDRVIYPEHKESLSRGCVRLQASWGLVFDKRIKAGTLFGPFVGPGESVSDMLARAEDGLVRFDFVNIDTTLVDGGEYRSCFAHGVAVRQLLYLVRFLVFADPYSVVRDQISKQELRILQEDPALRGVNFYLEACRKFELKIGYEQQLVLTRRDAVINWEQFTLGGPYEQMYGVPVSASTRSHQPVAPVPEAAELSSSRSPLY